MISQLLQEEKKGLLVVVAQVLQVQLGLQEPLAPVAPVATMAPMRRLKACMINNVDTANELIFTYSV